jgi:hypothetical protein
MTFLTNELQELFHPTALRSHHNRPSPPGCRRDPADHWARTPGHKLKSTPQGKQWKILHWSSKKCGQLQGNLGKTWRKWGLTRLTLDFSKFFKGISYVKVWKHQWFISQHFRNAIFRQPLERIWWTMGILRWMKYHSPTWNKGILTRL